MAREVEAHVSRGTPVRRPRQLDTDQDDLHFFRPPKALRRTCALALAGEVEHGPDVEVRHDIQDEECEEGGPERVDRETPDHPRPAHCGMIACDGRLP